MSFIKIFKKSEKGSITLMVLTAMIFLLVVITASYFAISNKSGNQDKKISKIAQQYRASMEDMNQEYTKTLNSVTNLTMEQVRSDGMFDRTINTNVTDDYGNEIVVPAGFKVTEDATNVTEGIVIEDKEGNQFVWIPVGDIYTDIEKTESGKRTITLERYDFANDGTPSVYSGTYTEDTAQNHNSEYGNAIAKDIDAFKSSANKNHGYYIGRYEAGVTGYDASSITTMNSNADVNWTGYKALDGNDLKLVCKLDQQVWNYVTQNKASELSQNIYTSSTFTSDLINSYAWDTAIVFIQEFSEDRDYSMQTSLQNTLVKTGKATDGKNNDVRCNIYDMAGNTLEWTTETYSYSDRPCVHRGGNVLNSNCYASYRGNSIMTYAASNYSFRPLLYLNN